eukprot:gene714-7887_t
MNFPTPVFVLIFLMVVVEVSLFSCASISFPSKQDHFRTAKTNAKNADRQNNNVLVNKNVHDTAAFNAAQEAGLIDQKSPDKEIYSVPIGTSHFNRSLIGSHRRLLLGISHLFGNQESPLFATSQRLERANTELESLILTIKHARNELEDLKTEINQLEIEKTAHDTELKSIRKKQHMLDMQLEKINQARNLKRKEQQQKIAERQKELDAKDIKALEDTSFRKHAFNEYKSSLLPLDRDIPDTRIKECLPLKWNTSKMPKASVIICFVNEAWSALLRTIWSVLNRTPVELLEEVVLVDDASDVDWLGEKLDAYIRDHLPSNVRIVKSPTRLGLIRARLLGAKSAKGPVLVFLDSHCEANVGWMEPILDIIADDRTTFVTPVIDAIDAHTMNYPQWSPRIPAVGTFDWSLDFNWKPGKLRPGQAITDPIDSPTMAGGLFAVEKKFFYDVGSYDEEMDGWGGENLEMSFRVWQCGGRLVTAPCSHVGHIFRDTHPYTVPGKGIHYTFMKNSMRLAEVWMDDYKHYFYDTQPMTKTVEMGDVSKRKELRERLHCKPFKWFLDHLLPDLFIPDNEHILHRGALRNSDGNCLDKMGQRAGGKAGVFSCHYQGGNQGWLYSTKQELRTAGNLCLDASSTNFPSFVYLQRCHQAGGNQHWIFDGSKIKHSEIKRNFFIAESLLPATNGCLASMMIQRTKQLRVTQCTAENTLDQSW